MTDTTTTEQYQTVEQLQQLPVDELVALWDSVPTERQTAYQMAYDSQLRASGGQHSDKAELLVIRDLITSYEQRAIVPMAEGYWTSVPDVICHAAKTGLPLKDDKPLVKADKSKSPLVLVGGGLAFIFMIGMALLRLSSSHSAQPTLTGTPKLSPTMATGTPILTITPTPLALSNQDSVIKGGDPAQNVLGSDSNNTSSNTQMIVYPINLRVFPAGATNPRVFVVQNRKINTAEWNFAPNPDTASYLAGLLIRPVVGIPWSDTNQQLFDLLDTGTTFELQMNTGGILRFNFVSKQSILRSNTQALRQSAPGLVLLLIGELDDNGLETATRLQIVAAYSPDQEMAADGSLAFAPLIAPTVIPPTPTLSPTPYERLQAELISVTLTQASANSPGYVTIRLHLVNEKSVPLAIGPDTLWMAFGYDPDPIEPRVPSEGLEPFQLLPNQAADITLYFPWNGETQASFGVNDEYRFRVQLIATKS